MNASGFNRTTQGTVRRQQALLPHHLIEGAWAHALGERTQVIPIHAQQIRTGK